MTSTRHLRFPGTCSVLVSEPSRFADLRPRTSDCYACSFLSREEGRRGPRRMHALQQLERRIA